MGFFFPPDFGIFYHPVLMPYFTMHIKLGQVAKEFAIFLLACVYCDDLFFADSPHLEQPEIFLLLQTVINILLPPRIISTSRTKNFMLDASPAHCSTPGDTGKDLRREGLAESTSQAAYLGMRRKR